MPTRKLWTHEISMEKNLEPKKYSREKISDPRNTHEKKNLGPKQYPRRHNGSKPTIACDPGNLTHSKWRHVKRWRYIRHVKKLVHVMHIKKMKVHKKIRTRKARKKWRQVRHVRKWSRVRYIKKMKALTVEIHESTLTRKAHKHVGHKGTRNT